MTGLLRRSGGGVNQDPREVWLLSSLTFQLGKSYCLRIASRDVPLPLASADKGNGAACESIAKVYNRVEHSHNSVL